MVGDHDRAKPEEGRAQVGVHSLGAPVEQLGDVLGLPDFGQPLIHQNPQAQDRHRSAPAG